MWESIWEWIKFWLGCIHDGFEVGDCLFGISEFCLALLLGYLAHRKRHQCAKEWEDRAVKWVWIVLGSAFVGSTVFIAPFLKFKEADTRKTTQEKFDYIQQNRPYLEVEMVTESFNPDDSVYYHFEVKNTGNLPAFISTQEQRSSSFEAPQFQEFNKFIAPQGHITIPSSPATIADKESLHLYIEFKAEYQGTNLCYTNDFRFVLQKLVGRQYPQMDTVDLIEDPVKGTNKFNSILHNEFDKPFGSFSVWLKDGDFYESSTNRFLVYNEESKIAVFKSTLTNGKPIILTSEVVPFTKTNRMHFLFISWNENGAALCVDSNQYSYPANFFQKIQHPQKGIKVFNHALSPEERKQLMEEGPPTNN